MRIMPRREAERLLRLRDFASRALNHPGGVYVHAASGTRYLPIHPFADEADLLARLGITAEACQIVDAYWEVGGDACFMQVWSETENLGCFARWSDNKLPWLNVVGRVPEASVSRTLFETVMTAFVERGIPTAAAFAHDIGDRLVAVGEPG